MPQYIRATPYDFPYDGSLSPATTALLSIDMQRDFLDEGGYVHSMGYDLAPFRKTIAPTRSVLSAARQHDFFVVHTRAGRRRDMSDVPAVKKSRSSLGGAEFGAEGALGRFLVRG